MISKTRDSARNRRLDTKTPGDARGSERRRGLVLALVPFRAAVCVALTQEYGRHVEEHFDGVRSTTRYRMIATGCATMAFVIGAPLW